MRALILTGEVTHQRPMSYGFTGDWVTTTLSLIDPEFTSLCEKYENAGSITHAEFVSFLRRAYDRSLVALHAAEIDAVVGIGYGAHVLVNLNSSHEWRGASTFIVSEGNPLKYCFASGPLPDDQDYQHGDVSSAWFVVDDDRAQKKRTNRSGSSIRKITESRRSDTVICVPNITQMNKLYVSGVVSSITRTLL